MIQSFFETQIPISRLGCGFDDKGLLVLLLIDISPTHKPLHTLCLIHVLFSTTQLLVVAKNYHQQLWLYENKTISINPL
ncbi:hypothetical protein NIES21_60750 (plasmid) [Anabaenopsis circularis NIES-21]|uniref:Uncharacterized protein n=1 Tax=Anabaenopsis circularis NIES-21 TaxID=1085406 RepID=A0A1Z4GRR9_9CYAN|nr:hypothetical protein NIES21_60750 [Anabaenopsis circularis NIES-21]